MPRLVSLTNENAGAAAVPSRSRNESEPTRHASTPPATKDTLPAPSEKSPVVAPPENASPGKVRVPFGRRSCWPLATVGLVAPLVAPRESTVAQVSASTTELAVAIVTLPLAPTVRSPLLTTIVRTPEAEGDPSASWTETRPPPPCEGEKPPPASANAPSATRAEAATRAARVTSIHPVVDQVQLVDGYRGRRELQVVGPVWVCPPDERIAGAHRQGDAVVERVQDRAPRRGRGRVAHQAGRRARRDRDRQPEVPHPARRDRAGEHVGRAADRELVSLPRGQAHGRVVLRQRRPEPDRERDQEEHDRDYPHRSGAVLLRH